MNEHTNASRFCDVMITLLLPTPCSHITQERNNISYAFLSTNVIHDRGNRPIVIDDNGVNREQMQLNNDSAMMQSFTVSGITD